MRRALWTDAALQDLQHVSLYIEERGTLVIANRVCRAIYQVVQRLRRFPEMGKAGPVEGTLECVVAEFPAYIVSYRIAREDTIEILRIWHGAQRRSS